MGQTAALVLIALTVVLFLVLTYAAVRFVPAMFEENDHGGHGGRAT